MDYRTMGRWWLWATVLFITLAAGGTAGEEAKDAAKPPADWPAKFRVGYFPQGGEQSLTNFGLVCSGVGARLGIEFEVVAKKSYQEIIVGLCDRSLEAAYLGPNSYVEAHDACGVEAVAMELGSGGERGYHSLLIAKKGSGIEKVQDARDQVLAFTDNGSTSGFMIPLSYFLNQLKVTPAEFASSVKFAGSHRNVIVGVNQGQYDLGATNDRDLVRAITELKLEPDALAVVWTSRMLPAGPMGVRKGLPASLKKALGQALVELDDESAFASLGIGGFSAVTDADYDVIRELRRYYR